MIERLRERPGKVIPMLLFAVVAAFWPTAAGIGAAFVVYLLAAVPMFVLWVYLHRWITGESWNL